MFGFRKISGIIMVRDQEVLSFQLDHEQLDFQEITPVEDLVWKPFDFMNGYSRLSIREFLEDRLTPIDRQGIEQSCEDAGISLDADEMIRYNCGRAVDDDCWIKFPDGPQTWEECKQDWIEKSDRVLQKQRERLQ